MQIIGIIHCSAGNESVGEMWHETKIFTPDQPMQDVIDWLAKVKRMDYYMEQKGEVILSIADK